jgi:hypothetical protein
MSKRATPVHIVYALVPGSKRIKRLAPIRLIPHPPALLLNRKMNSLPSGSLNRSTSFCRLVMLIVPSSRKHPYLRVCTSSVEACTKRKGRHLSLLGAAELLEQVQRLRVIADQHDLVIRFRVDVM